MKWQYLFKDKILHRGYDYYLQDNIINYSFINNTIKATVKGRHDYQVEIILNKNGNIFHMFCDCPYCFEGNKCKHMAALLFYYDNKQLINTNNNRKDIKDYKKLIDDLLVNNTNYSYKNYAFIVDEIKQFLTLNLLQLLKDKNNYTLVLDIMEHLNQCLYNFKDESLLSKLSSVYKEIYKCIIENSDLESRQVIYDKLKSQVTNFNSSFITSILWYVILYYFDDSYIEDKIASLKKEIDVALIGDDENIYSYVDILANFCLQKKLYNQLKSLYQQFSDDIYLCYIYINVLYEQEKYKQVFNLASRCIKQIENYNSGSASELYYFYQFKIMSALLLDKKEIYKETSIKFLKIYGFDKDKYELLKQNYPGNILNENINDLIDYYHDNNDIDSLINICLYEKKEQELAFYVSQFNETDFLKYKYLCQQYPNFLLERYRQQIMFALDSPFKNNNYPFIIDKLNQMLEYQQAREMVLSLIDIIKYKFKDNKVLIKYINEFYNDNF